MGPEGTVAAVTIELPQACAKQVSFLWLKVLGWNTWISQACG
jgi:hypothetical protein